jgi:hypothetical protein
MNSNYRAFLLEGLWDRLARHASGLSSQRSFIAYELTHVLSCDVESAKEEQPPAPAIPTVSISDIRRRAEEFLEMWAVVHQEHPVYEGAPGKEFWHLVLSFRRRDLEMDLAVYRFERSLKPGGIKQ